MKKFAMALVLGNFFVLSMALGATPNVIGNLKAPKSGTFYLNLGKEPEKLNPITSTDYYASQVQGYAMESLLERNANTYEWEPLLAVEHKISDDMMTFEFTLRDGVKWQDGKPLTVEDVKFSFDVIFDPNFPTAHIRPYYESIEKAEIIAPNKIRFKAKNKYFGNFDSVAGLTVVPKHIYGASDKKALKKLNKTLIGSGPYLLEKYEKGKRIVLQRNKNWWGNLADQQKPKYNFEKIVMRFVSEESIALEMLKKGEIDFKGLTPEDFMQKATGPKWGKDVFKVKTENKAPKSYNYIGWNLESELFKDKKVRVAMAHLMNRKLMIEKFKYNLSLPAVGPWHPSSIYASPKVSAIDFDTKKALKLLNEAGWKDSDKDMILDKVVNGKKYDFRMTIITANEDIMKYLTIYKEDAKKAGVEVNIKQVEWNTLLKLVDEKKFDAICLGWGGGSVDIDPKQIWHSSSAVKGGSNFISYKNSQVDKLIDEAREIGERDLRAEKFKVVYELIAEDAPYLFLFTEQYDLYAHTKKMKREADTYQYRVGLDYWWVTN